MPKIAIGTEVVSVTVFDSKFASGAKSAATKAVEKVLQADSKYAPGKPASGGYHIRFKGLVEQDASARTLQGSSTWEINVVEGSQRKLFTRLKQAKPATATVPDVPPTGVKQADVDEAIATAIAAELKGLLKKLP